MLNEPTKIAETARQERARGGQRDAESSGDPSTTAAGPHDKPDLATDATKGSQVPRRTTIWRRGANKATGMAPPVDPSGRVNSERPGALSRRCR
jgi:hypothetical protein